MSLDLDRHASLAIKKVGQTLVADVTNTETGQSISLSYPALLKLMTSISFLADARETLLKSEERRALLMASEGRVCLKPTGWRRLNAPEKARKRTVKRRLQFEDEESPIPASQTRFVHLEERENQAEWSPLSSPETMDFSQGLKSTGF